ncbi:hypothetical protein DRN77_04165 [Methanosarcinales archaeon]|nr:MAG: hypothetical protein DRN77_04165 [Methanosarcinales archaeon]
MNTKKLVVIGIMLLCIAVMPAMAQENNTTANETNVTVTPTIEPTAAETAVPVPTVAKFRVAPTVTLRPVNDVIDKSQDGLVELYMNNPSLNDVTLTADVQVAVPSGIHVYGEGFGYGAAAGTVAGTFTVPPGTVRTIHINIKSEKTGTFTVHFTGLYWPDDDKDAFQQISLTHPLTVKEPSPDPTDPKPTGNGGRNELPYTYIIIGCLAVIAIVIIAMMIRKPPKTEVVIEEE